LTFSAVCVVAKQFVAVWKVNNLPTTPKNYPAEAERHTAPNAIGVLNARQTSKAQARVN